MHWRSSQPALQSPDFPMAKGLFVVGFSVAEVLQIQSRAKEMLTEGKTVMSWGDSGSSVGKQFPMSVKEVLEECAYALSLLDPATYRRGRKRIAVSKISGYLPK